MGAGLHYLQSPELMLGTRTASDLVYSRSLFKAHRFRWSPLYKLRGTETMYYTARRSMDPSHSSRYFRSNLFESENRSIGGRPRTRGSGSDPILPMSKF